MPTAPVYRFEAWPDFTADHPDTVRLITSTLPYFDPTVWVFPAGATDEEKINLIVAEYQSGKQRIAEDSIAESFSFKHYKDDFLVGIHTGVVAENGAHGKTYTAHGTFFGEDETGTRDWAKGGSACFIGIEEFMNEHGITFYKMALKEGHFQIDRNRHLGNEPAYEEMVINPVTNLEERVFVYNMFDIIEQHKPV